MNRNKVKTFETIITKLILILALCFLSLCAETQSKTVHKHIAEHNNEIVNAPTKINPVILMHGILSNYKDLDDLKGYILEVFPGTPVYSINAYNEIESVVFPMGTQITNVTRIMEGIMAKHPGGVNLICFSQGGLLCRGVLQASDKHNVQTFVALSSPLAGQFGDTSYLKELFPNALKDTLYLYMYTAEAQRKISVAGYWKDPHHLDFYQKDNIFLPLLNNETFNSKSEEYRTNFLRVKRVIMIGGPDDGVITPWQSSHFGFYAPGTDKEVQEMQDTKYYADDSFGLKTMYERGSLKTFVVPGVHHTSWHSTRSVFDDCIQPWLL